MIGKHLRKIFQQLLINFVLKTRGNMSQLIFQKFIGFAKNK